ncbi:trihelix transcription factor ASR3 [Senna tora]|uniref:Trihelix transcription factor ASR3 n=1 Tax=Senna tora TaxID=362788 RepID=A0A834X1W2_9FABA|nr:trihelix transcription factor ASR3 [Senna tora]
MALEQQLSLGPNPNPLDGGTDGKNAGDDSSKAPRLPRWTRQDILVLIQGKRDAENRFRRGRVAGLPFGSGQIEPKWASVSSYCKKHGVNREPVQCRKRWSNLAGDYKKIKEWESQMRDETESYWVLRNDLRRERKLPGFFDKEVYDILESGSQTPALVVALASAPASVTTETVNKGKDDGGGVAAEEAEVDIEQHLYDSNRSAAVEDGLFSDFEQEEVYASSEKEAAAKTDVSAPTTVIPAPINISAIVLFCVGCTDEKQPASNPEVGSTSQGGRKRKRFGRDGEEETLEYQLIDVLERNGKMLNSQLETQNKNLRLDREQRKDQTSNLVAVLDKLADALARIADKL